MRTLDPPRFYCGRRRFRAFELYCHVTLIGLRFRQVHSSFATFVVAPTQRGHTIVIPLCTRTSITTVHTQTSNITVYTH